MEDIKKRLVEAGRTWIAQQIDSAVEHNPRLAFIAKRLKDGLGNTLANKVDAIEPYLPFITDESGKLNVQSVSAELLNAFEEMPVRDYEVMGLGVKVGKGRIVALFPENILTGLFLDNNRLVIGRADLEELVKVLDNY